jgi:hypothetical protein
VLRVRGAAATTTDTAQPAAQCHVKRTRLRRVFSALERAQTREAVVLQQQRLRGGIPSG